MGILDAPTYSRSQADARFVQALNTSAKIPEYFVPAPSGDTTGVTDTASIQALENTATALGGRLVFSAAPTSAPYIVTGLIKKSNTWWQGVGRGNGTVIKLANATNADVIKGDNFSTLTGGNTRGGITNFGIAGMAIDGNKANQTGTSYGVRVYAYDYDVDGLEIRNCYTDGFYSEWAIGVSPASSYDQSMESYIANVKTHDNGGNGFYFAGPHDSQVNNLISYSNGGVGVWADSSSSFSAAGVQFVNCHSWGSSQTYAWQIDSQAHCINCQAEGASIAQVYWRAGDSTWIGGSCFAPGSSSTYGMIFGDVTHQVGGININTKILNHIGGALNFVNTGGNNIVKTEVYQVSGTIIAGTANNADRLEVHAAGITNAAGLSKNQMFGPFTIDVGQTGLGFLVKASGTQLLNANTSAGTKQLQLVNGMSVQLYSDGYTTSTGSWNATNGALSIISISPSTSAHTVKGAGGQTAALTLWKDSSNNTLAQVTASGRVDASAGDGITTKPIAGPVSDASFATAPPDATVAVDIINNVLYFRSGGVWQTVQAGSAGASTMKAFAIAMGIAL